MKRHSLEGARSVIGQDDPAFPPFLKNICNSPEQLYVIGDAAALQPGLAIVGARRSTPYGASCARRFARIAAAKGIVIISGGARGCDCAAHKGALDAGGRTVVFLGGGCDQLYPKENQGLFQQVVDAGGAVVSEHPWDFKPLPYTFRLRNRLIAGLSRAVLIVEAGLPSGTFSTADAAVESGKEVLVVPGSITSANSRGANRLIYQGATPVIDDEVFEDALFAVYGVLKQEEHAGKQTPLCEATARRGAASAILSAINAQPTGMDDLYMLARMEFGGQDYRARLLALLIEAESKGIVARQADGKWGPCVKV